MKTTMTAFTFLLSGDSLTSVSFYVLIVGLLAYISYGAIWRLYLSPIAHIPGPRFAALTFWNEFYYDVVLGGKYTWKLLEYHEVYGTVEYEIFQQLVATLKQIRPRYPYQPLRGSCKRPGLLRRTIRRIHQGKV